MIRKSLFFCVFILFLTYSCNDNRWTEFDDVNIKNGLYTFFWEDSQEQAKLLATKEFELMRFKWTISDEDDTYFEMRIKIDELTGDVALIITDFAKKEELDEVQRLWDAQIHDLCKALGS